MYNPFFNHRNFNDLQIQSISQDVVGIQYFVNIPSLDVRQGPGIEFNVIGTLDYPSLVSGTGRLSGEWTEIIREDYREPNLIGWVPTSSLNIKAARADG